MVWDMDTLDTGVTVGTLVMDGVTWDFTVTGDIITIWEAFIRDMDGVIIVGGKT
jgi:hypothetical protein